MNRSLIKKKYYNIAILIFGIIVVIGIVIAYSFFSSKQLSDYACYTVEYYTKDISEEIDSEMLSCFNSIQFTSHLVTQSMDSTELKHVNEILTPLLERTPFQFIEYVNQDGINYTQEGDAFDASDRVYFSEGMRGETDVWINYTPKYSKEYLMNFYTPLYYNEKIVGVLTGVLGTNTNISPLLQKEFYGEQMLGVLLDEEGHIVSTSDGNSSDSLEGLLQGYNIRQKDIALCNSYLSEASPEVFILHGKGGSFYSYIVKNTHTNWYVLLMIPSDSFRAVVRKNVSGVYLIAALISFVMLLLFFHIIIDSKNKQKLLAKKQEQEVQNLEQILTTTASDTYKGIRRVDLESEYSDYIYFENHRVHQKDIGDWTKWLNAQAKNIHSEDYEKVSQMASIHTLRKMKEGDSVTINYRSASLHENGYCRMYSTTISVSIVNGRKMAILSTIDNTSAVVSEMEHKKLLASAASIYISMHVFDLKNDEMETLNCAEHISKIVGEQKTGVQALVQNVMTKMTDEQYRDAMMEFIDFKTIDERMEGRNTITLEFIGVKSGWCRARFIAVDYDENHRLNRVLWVIENIDAEKRKANQLLYLSETDLMTEIRNRGSGERKIKELLSSGYQGTFMLMDVDKFKSINDNYGHAIGDQVLISLAKCLKETFRECDIVMRLGGDEFAVFAQDVVDIPVAKELINRFFDRLNDIKIPELGDYNITVSLGAAIRHVDDGIDFETLYHNADVCVYKSKKEIGNFSTFFEENN